MTNVRNAVSIYFREYGKFLGGLIALYMLYNIGYTVFFIVTGAWLLAGLYTALTAWLIVMMVRYTKRLHAITVESARRRAEFDARMAETRARIEKAQQETEAYLAEHRARMREIRGE